MAEPRPPGMAAVEAAHVRRLGPADLMAYKALRDEALDVFRRGEVDALG